METYKERNVNKAFSLLTVCGVALAASSVALTFPEKRPLPVDPQYLSDQQKAYCSQVERWRRERMLGVPADVRQGYADYKATYNDWCTGR
ncbi:MAG: hypothetical protein UMU75_08040 [Halomonas sp.]|nr:hypothetical protein [Halomonas sp.]